MKNTSGFDKKDLDPIKKEFQLIHTFLKEKIIKNQKIISALAVLVIFAVLGSYMLTNKKEESINEEVVNSKNTEQNININQPTTSKTKKDSSNIIKQDETSIKSDYVEKTKKIGYLNFSNAVSSSELSASTQSNYAVKNTADSNIATAWVEGVAGDGIGEWISFNDVSEREISKIEIFSGYHKSESLYYANNRVKKIGIGFSDGTYLEKALEDNFGLSNTIYLNQPIKTSSIKFTILDVYKGIKYQDTCISEIQFIGK